MRLIVTLLLVLVTSFTFAQSRKKRKESRTQTQQSAPSSLNPGFPEQQAYAPKKSRGKKSGGPTYESQEEYADRMRATVKAKRKAEREMEKPQYSDPSYFGHKRKPKRHSAKKMRLCKECGIRH